MRWLSRPVTLALLIASLICGVAGAEHNSDKSPATKAAASAEEIARWLNDLGSQDFTVRELASRKLVDAGEAAVEPVAQLSDTDNLELAMRGLFILKEQLQSKDDGVKADAKKALEKLATSRRASVAKRAQAILNPPADNLAPNGINPGQLPLRFLPGIAGGPRNVRVSSRTQNGRTEMNITEDDRNLVISHANGKDIEVGIEIQKPGDKDRAKPKEWVFQSFKAKDADELKQKHPEAYRFFERYASGKGVPDLPANAIPLIGPLPNQAPGNAVPRIQPWGMLGPKTIIDTDHLKKTLQEIEAAQTELQRLSERLQTLVSKDNPDREALKKLAEEIRAANERIKAARLKLFP